jgi:hypothetical protein
MLHHENFALSVDVPANYQIDSLQKWAREIQRAAQALMGDLDGA